MELADAFLADFSDGEGDDQGGDDDGSEMSSDGAQVDGDEGSGSDDDSEDEAATKQALTYETVTKLLHDPRLPAHVQVRIYTIHTRAPVCLARNYCACLYLCFHVALGLTLPVFAYVCLSRHVFFSVPRSLKSSWLMQPTPAFLH